MLVREDHVAGGRIMLVGKDHAGGEGSCWWGMIMLVLQDDEKCKNVIFATKTFWCRHHTFAIIYYLATTT